MSVACEELDETEEVDGRRVCDAVEDPAWDDAYTGRCVDGEPEESGESGRERLLPLGEGMCVTMMDHA